MCNDTAPKVIAYFASNFVRPNLIVDGPYGRFDLTATFASIELSYGSKTECDEKETLRRRAAKEALKLECVRWAISGHEEGDTELTAKYWLLPEYPAHKEGCYTAFTDAETLESFGVKPGTAGG